MNKYFEIFDKIESIYSINQFLKSSDDKTDNMLKKIEKLNNLLDVIIIYHLEHHTKFEKDENSELLIPSVKNLLENTEFKYYVITDRGVKYIARLINLIFKTMTEYYKTISELVVLSQKEYRNINEKIDERRESLDKSIDKYRELLSSDPDNKKYSTQLKDLVDEKSNLNKSKRDTREFTITRSTIVELMPYFIFVIFLKTAVIPDEKNPKKLVPEIRKTLEIKYSNYKLIMNRCQSIIKKYLFSRLDVCDFNFDDEIDKLSGKEVKSKEFLPLRALANILTTLKGTFKKIPPKIDGYLNKLEYQDEIYAPTVKTTDAIEFINPSESPELETPPIPDFSEVPTLDILEEIRKQMSSTIKETVFHNLVDINNQKIIDLNQKIEYPK